MTKPGAIIHCSASNFGTVDWIRKIHTEERKWNDIGYHKVILNGAPAKGVLVPELDGVIRDGRPIAQDGAHAKGYNDWIGICVIGDNYFSTKQIFNLVTELKAMKIEFGFRTEDIKGHCELPNVKKTCPNIDMDMIRWLVDLE